MKAENILSGKLLCSIVLAFSGRAAEEKGCLKAFQNKSFAVVFVDFGDVCLLFFSVRGEVQQMLVLTERYFSA